MRFLYVCMALLALLNFSGCQADVQVSNDAKDAVESYKVFVDTLRTCSKEPQNCDKKVVWDQIDVTTKSQFVNAYITLARIDRIIETYFDPIEYREMRARTGTDILVTKQIKDGYGLFAYLFHPEKLTFDDQSESGLKIADADVLNSRNVVIQTNEKGQDFHFIQESDDKWRVILDMSIVGNALNPITKSNEEMTEYARSYLQDELDRRKRVREYFFEQLDKQNKQTKELLQRQNKK